MTRTKGEYFYKPSRVKGKVYMQVWLAGGSGASDELVVQLGPADKLVQKLVRLGWFEKLN